MKNFKIFLVETLIQLTILLSITQNQNNSRNQFEDLLKNSIADFQKQYFSGIEDSYSKERNKGEFDFNLPKTPKEVYLSEIIRSNQHRQDYQLYLNPFNCLRVTDKFLEYPEIQTKNSLVCFCNNATISLEVRLIEKKNAYQIFQNFFHQRIWTK